MFELLNGRKAYISEQLGMVLTCKAMKWDYHTYMSQPSWFIELLGLVSNIEADYKNRMAKMAESRARKK